jgi:thymidylate kinase
MTKEEHEVLELTRDARTVFVSQLVARLTEREIREFFEKVRQGYLHLAVEQPGRMVVLDAAQTPEQIEEQVWKLVEERCHALQS